MAAPDEPRQPGEEPAPARASMPPRWGLLALAPAYVLAPLVLALGLRTAGFEAFTAEGPSMEPTLRGGDHFVIDKTAFGFRWPLDAHARVSWGEPEVGDVVVLRSPEDGLDLVKRVVARAGQRVEVREDGFYVDGAPLAAGPAVACPDEPACAEQLERVGARAWRTRRSTLAEPDLMAPRVVPEGHVFVLGDHRDRSNDSRGIGPIAVSRVAGRALLIYASSRQDGLRIAMEPIR